MMDYAKALCWSIPSLHSDPKSEKKYACQSFVPKWQFDLVYDKEEFPSPPTYKTKAQFHPFYSARYFHYQLLLVGNLHNPIFQNHSSGCPRS